MSLIIPNYCKVFANRFKDLCKGIVPGSYFVGLEMLFFYFVEEFDSVAELLRNSAWTLSESHFLSMVDKFPANRFMRRLRWSILSRYKNDFNPARFVFAIDDTDNPKYANISSVANWRGSKGKYYGQKILVIALVDIQANFAIPLGFKFCKPKKDPNHVKVPSLAIELIKEVTEFGFPKFNVVTDSWFDSVEFAKNIQDLGCQYIWELKSNRNIKTNPGPNVPWSKLPDVFYSTKRTRVTNRKGGETKKWISNQRIKISGRKCYLNAIAAYNRKNGRNAFGFYASTDLSISGARIWRISRARWAIECLFRDLKQNLSFGQFPSGNENAINLAVVVPFIIITLLRIQPEIFGLQKSTTVGGMVRLLRREERNRNLEMILKNPQHTKLGILREKASKISGKPCTPRRGKVKRVSSY